MNEIYSIVLLTLKICIISSLISGIFAIFLAFYLGLNENKFIKILKILINAFTSLPPVIAGVFVYLIFSKNGILGSLSWLYTEKVIIIAQILIVTPIICANIYPAVESIKSSFMETCLVLENNKGNYSMSIRLGIILMLISFGVSFLAMIFSRRDNDKVKKLTSQN